MVAGIIALIKNLTWDKSHNLLLIPVILHLVLSSLKLYPFDAQLYLYTIPTFIIFIGKGWEFIQTTSGKYNPKAWTLSVLIFPILSLAGLYLHGFPIKKNELKPLLHYYQANAKSDEGLYVSVGARHIVQYYHQTGYFSPKGKY